MKSEPDECSIDDALAAPDRTVPWTGVRNYQARNFMRDAMQVGDGVLFYHSSCPEPGIVGIARVASGTPARPDAVRSEVALLRRQARSPRSRAGCCSTCRRCARPALLALPEMRADAGAGGHAGAAQGQSAVDHAGRARRTGT